MSLSTAGKQTFPVNNPTTLLYPHHSCFHRGQILLGLSCELNVSCYTKHYFKVMLVMCKLHWIKSD